MRKLQLLLFILPLVVLGMKKPENAKPTLIKEAPPGAPIGCDEED